MVYELYVGSRYTGVSVRQDAKWPTMWRIHQGEKVSDIVNLARAKDAAVTWWRPKGISSSDVIRWKARQTDGRAAHSA